MLLLSQNTNDFGVFVQLVGSLDMPSCMARVPKSPMIGFHIGDIDGCIFALQLKLPHLLGLLEQILDETRVYLKGIARFYEYRLIETMKPDSYMTSLLRKRICFSISGWRVRK